MQAKLDFRKSMLAQRKAMSAEARDAEDALIAANVLALPQFERAEYVLAYLAFGSEAGTRRIIERAQQMGKAVAVPRCADGAREMRWFEYGGPECLERSAMGMEEPRPESCREIDAQEYNIPGTVAIVPGLAFDEQGFRIGYGGGFYDAFLNSFNGTSIGLCRRAFLVENLHALGVCEAHDLPVSIVATPDLAIGIE